MENKQSHFISNSIKWIIMPAFAIAFLAGIIVLQIPNLEPKDSLITKEQYLLEEQQKRLRLDFLKKIPSFGLRNLIANWAFLDFVQYYGDGKARAATGNSLAPDYFELIVNRDPRFIRAFFILDPATSLFAGRPEKSVNFLSQSLKYVSPKQDLAYQLWNFKGVGELLFLGKTQEARKSYEMAAKWAGEQNTELSLQHAKIAEETAEFLATNPDSRKARAGAWMMILGNARDEQTRIIALNNLRAIGAKVEISADRISVSVPEKD